MNTADINRNAQLKNNSYKNDESDRVAVIFDVRNVTARQNQEYCNSCINYTKLLADIIGNRKCIAAVAVDSYIIDPSGKDSAKFFHNQLKVSGFRLELVPPSNNVGKQEGVDVKIGLIAQKFVLNKECDVIELITGDGDFTILAEDLQNEGARVNVTSFRKSLSYSLRNKADCIRILDDMPVIKMYPKPEIKEVA